MPYDILSDDLVDDGSDPQPRRTRRRNTRGPAPPPRPFFLRPMFIHLLLILILLVFIGIFLQKTYNVGNFSVEEELGGEVTIAGDLGNFSKTYNGNISIYSAKFTLETSTGTFDDVSKDINIEEFNGEIYLDNSSIVLEGKGKKITYGKNTIKLDNSDFKLISSKKTSVELVFDKIDLVFEEGNLKLDNTFNYDFENTTLKLEGFNTTMSYDNTFTFFGKPKSFTIDSPNDKLNIQYKDD